MIDYLLEHGGFKEALNPNVLEDIPDNAGTVVRSRHSLSVVLADLNVSDSSSMLFERSFHDLCLRADSPYTYFAFHTARHNSCAVIGWHERRYTMIVGVIDSIE